MELGNSRQERVCSDTRKAIEYIENASPFKGDLNVLRSLATGISVGEKVNINEDKTLGAKIVEKMTGKALQNSLHKRLINVY
jgi:hypothetical protein